jgi:hypothetical protein
MLKRILMFACVIIMPYFGAFAEETKPAAEPSFIEMAIEESAKSGKPLLFLYYNSKDNKGRNWNTIIHAMCESEDWKNLVKYHFTFLVYDVDKQVNKITLNGKDIKGIGPVLKKQIKDMWALNKGIPIRSWPAFFIYDHNTKVWTKVEWKGKEREHHFMAKLRTLTKN